MVNKTISISYELYLKLKNESNASDLISNLLLKHYNFKEQNKLSATEKLKILREKKKEEEVEKLLIAEDLINQAELIKQTISPIIEKVLSEEEQLLKEIEIEKDRENIRELQKQVIIEREQCIKSNLFNTFKEEVGREMSEEEYQEYQGRINEVNFNFFKFCDLKRGLE